MDVPSASRGTILRPSLDEAVKQPIFKFFLGGGANIVFHFSATASLSIILT